MEHKEMPSRILRFYAALESASEEMLQAARDGDWDAVCRLEGACGIVIARLRDLMQHESFKPSEQGERMRILRSIIANDAEIRRIAEPLSYASQDAVDSWSLLAASTMVH